MAYVPNSGSVVAFQSDPTKLVGTVSVIGSIGITGTPSISGTVNIGTTPGSVVSFQGGTQISSISGQVTVVSSLAGGIFPISGSVAATITNTTVPISGSVATFQAGTVRSSISGNITVVSSIAGGIFPVSGSVAAVITNTNLNVSGSVAGWLQSTNASVITILQASSIAGTYAEDTAHANDSRGLFVLGVRNDTLASVTSANGDLSPFITGPTGEMIVANAPITRWVQGTNSVMYGASVAVLAAQGSSIFTYVTGVQITNDSANYSRVTFQGASSSVIGYVPAPANSGAVFTLPNAWKSNANGAITASITGVSSIYVSLQGFISKT